MFSSLSQVSLSGKGRTHSDMAYFGKKHFATVIRIWHILEGNILQQLFGYGISGKETFCNSYSDIAYLGKKHFATVIRIWHIWERNVLQQLFGYGIPWKEIFLSILVTE